MDVFEKNLLCFSFSTATVRYSWKEQRDHEKIVVGKTQTVFFPLEGLLFENLICVPFPLHRLCYLSQSITKLTKWPMRPAKTQISLGIRPVWSEYSRSARRNLGSLATHWAHSEDSDQTGWMPRLIWVFACAHVIVLVLSICGSLYYIASLTALQKRNSVD